MCVCVDGPKSFNKGKAVILIKKVTRCLCVRVFVCVAKVFAISENLYKIQTDTYISFFVYYETTTKILLLHLMINNNQV